MISFFVPGVPIPKGSAKSFYNPKAHKVVTMQDNRDRQRPWASLIAYTAQEVGCKPVDGPVKITLHFFFPRPKNHYGTGKNINNLKESAPTYHITTPDLDKLERCVLDSLTGVVWHDDKQVREMASKKDYVHATSEGVAVMIEEV